ncbi:MAG: CARDB domain-containing protein [Chloroflexota bacterium]
MLEREKTRGATDDMIEVARGRTDQLTVMRRRSPHARRWQSLVAALLALLAVEGQPAAAASTMPGPSKLAEQWTTITSRTLTPFVPATTVAANGVSAQAGAAIPATRPDLSVSFAHLDEAQAGQRFTYTVQLRNDGGPAGTAIVNTVLPPQISNVRVTAPGFVCTRHFAASGPQAGTLVSCTRNDFDSGGAADVVVEANAPSAAGPVRLVATADPRDDVMELDESNNEANATVQVR